MYHQSVLLQESLDGLNIRPDGIYVDATFGGGGHARAILEKLENGRLIAFDQDKDSFQNQISDNRFLLVHENFKYFKNFVRYQGHDEIDGLLADLGVSSHQFDTAERGFSIRNDAPLDARMNRTAAKTAADVVNTYTESELNSLWRRYADFQNPSRISRLIINQRNKHALKSNQQLIACLGPVLVKGKENQVLARIFQALRMEVNQEESALEALLIQSAEMIRPKGRLVVISYHSVEDRMVKNFIKTGNIQGMLKKDFYGNIIRPFEAVNRKAISPQPEEIKINKRARSAKLRIAEKK